MALALALALTAAACADDAGTPAVASVEVSLARTTLVKGESAQATATAKDASGNPLTGRKTTWTSSSPQVATVDATTGLVTGQGAGSATITAEIEGVRGTSSIDVTPPPPQMVLVAGTTGGAGNVDGTGAAARFSNPSGVATDGSGNVYVADTGNSTIRKITPAGVSSTVAGTAGVAGSADGTGGAASFMNPSGVATDASGNAYVADQWNNTIRKITPSGVVTTLAGSPAVAGSSDGTGSAATFNGPGAVAIDASGNVYVADTFNFTIRKVTPAGVVTTVAGMAGAMGSTDGPGAAARFFMPSGVATDASGNVYVADSGNHTIRMITPAGLVTTFVGAAGALGSADGTGPGARFNSPSGVATDASGNVYVADSGSHTIRKVTPGGVVTTLAGTPGADGSADGPGAAASFNSPTSVAADAAGNVYVADFLNHTIRRINPAGVVTTLAGATVEVGWVDGAGSAARFKEPTGVVPGEAGGLYVVDGSNDVIRTITAEGVVSTLAGTAGMRGGVDGTGAAARFNGPRGAAKDAAGNLYVADAFNYTIRKVTPAGVVTTIAGTVAASGSLDGTGAEARFFIPSGIAIDGAGNVYVADTGNSTIRKITPAGVVTTLAGRAGARGSSDGTGSAARFATPFGVACDASGNVYVADAGNHTIRKITPTGVVTTFAGKAGSSGSSDGLGVDARFFNPFTVVTDASDNLYVTDYSNHTIRKITPSGAVVTVAGQAGKAGYQAGPLPGILASPWGIAVSGTNLYVSTGQAIVKVTDRP